MASFLLLCAQSGVAQQHSSTLGMSARVVRSCAVATDADADSPIRLTCSRNATPGVVTTGSASGVTPVPPMRSTSIRVPAAPVSARAATMRPAALATAGEDGPDVTAVSPEVPEPPGADQPIAREIVTINF